MMNQMCQYRFGTMKKPRGTCRNVAEYHIAVTVQEEPIQTYSCSEHLEQILRPLCQGAGVTFCHVRWIDDF